MNVHKKSILILGAGPSGSSCAIQLLKAGHNVSIIDKSNFPRDCPGETVHPGVESLLKQLGVLDKVLKLNVIRHKGIEQIKNEISSFDFYNKDQNWEGFQLFRKDFDQLLLEEAIQLGAVFHESTTPLKVNRSTDIINSIETSATTISADYFIDATGKRAWLAKKLNINIEKYSPKRIAYYGYVKNSNYNTKNPKLIWNENGWIWISQVKNNIKAWVRLDLMNKTQVERNWIPQYLRDGESLGFRKAVDVTWRKSNTCSNQNYFLIGDAAFVLDPGSSHGILKAIMSGIMVSYLIETKRNIKRTHINEYYNKWLNDQFFADMNRLKDFYSEYKIKN